MASRFDSAWTTSDEALVDEMGEAVSIGGLTVTAVVDVAQASLKAGLMNLNTGVTFTVYLSAAQVATLAPGKGVPGLQQKEVVRGVFRGRVKAVRDLGGAGAELDVGPVSDR